MVAAVEQPERTRQLERVEDRDRDPRLQHRLPELAVDRPRADRVVQETHRDAAARRVHQRLAEHPPGPVGRKDVVLEGDRLLRVRDRPQHRRVGFAPVREQSDRLGPEEGLGVAAAPGFEAGGAHPDRLHAGASAPGNPSLARGRPRPHARRSPRTGRCREARREWSRLGAHTGQRAARQEGPSGLRGADPARRRRLGRARRAPPPRPRPPVVRAGRRAVRDLRGRAPGGAGGRLAGPRRDPRDSPFVGPLSRGRERGAVPRVPQRIRRAAPFRTGGGDRRPATRFIQEHRARIFASTPVLVAGADRRLVAPSR